MRSLPLGLALAAVCLAQSDLRVSGPYEHDNLTVYLVHSKSNSTVRPKRAYLPLKEALEQKKVVVHETQNVNELAIENVSTDVDVFVQGGDVVKGGQQDRVFTTDLILPPKSGKTPVATFCVEQGRWSKRGAESVRTFQTSSESVAYKDLKLAVKDGKDQHKVWEQVGKANSKMAMASGTGMVAGAAMLSPTSYQLNVERKEVAQKLEGYVKAISPVAARHADCVGFVYAVNGKFTGGEVYGSPGLFATLWPKLLKSAAVEASSEPSSKGKAVVRFSETEAKQVLVETKSASDGKPLQPNKRTRVARGETEKVLMFESGDAALGVDKAGWLHRSYVAK